MDLVAELSNIVGPEHVLTSADTTAAHTTDWTSRFHGEAFAVVRPADTVEVAAVVAACAAAGGRFILRVATQVLSAGAFRA